MTSMSSPFVNRAGWGARNPNGPCNGISSNPKGVAIHWEGPQMGTRPHGECDNIVRSIQNYHMDTQGWSDVAYNLMVCEHGYIFEGRGKGKGAAANGTTAGNQDYPAICALVGENDPQPPELDRGIGDAAAMVRSWGVGGAVKGHRDFVSTECPGSKLYDKVKSGKFSGSGSSTPAPTPTPDPDDGDLDVDGWLGSATTKAWQKIMGTPVDGVISEPSMLVEAVQSHLNAAKARDKEGRSLVVDGLGIQDNLDGRYPSSGSTNTIEALQSYLDVGVDGYFSAPSGAVKALQKRLNSGKF
jgi:hypothetical protein